MQYPNILGFNIGNEVVNSAEATVAAPFIKAAARDIKAYLSAYLDLAPLSDSFSELQQIEKFIRSGWLFFRRR